MIGTGARGRPALRPMRGLWGLWDQKPVRFYLPGESVPVRAGVPGFGPARAGGSAPTGARLWEACPDSTPLGLSGSRRAWPER